MDHYYRILGLSPGATKVEIKRAYRKMAMKYHPDKNPSEEARKIFIQIDEAYDVLYHGKRPKRSAFRSTTSTRSTSNRNTSRQSSSNRRNRKETKDEEWDRIFRRWANVWKAPLDPKDKAEWIRVKRQQEKDGTARRKESKSSSSLSPGEREFLKSMQKAGCYGCFTFLFHGVTIFFSFLSMLAFILFFIFLASGTIIGVFICLAIIGITAYLLYFYHKMQGFN